jgi:hypothetical protein
MKADLTRDTFHPLKNFTRVLLQQGRVQLDADWNEQSAILLRYIQALAADLIGPHGGPTANLGFQISDRSTNDFPITPGHYYVDGILCELPPSSAPIPITAVKNSNNQFKVPHWAAASLTQNLNKQVLLSGDGQSSLVTINAVSNDDVVTADTDVGTITTATNAKAYLKFTSYLTQADYPAPPALQTGSLIYLDVWERLITYIEDDNIREVALNGAETAARAKLVCQVRQIAPPSDGADPLDYLRSQLQPAHRGRLMAQAQQTSVSADPCVIPPDASYRGPENQLYRVEIHTGSNNQNPATFKWSRENGSVVFPIVNLAAGGSAANPTTTVVLENLGRDDRFGLSQNDWVEIQDDDYVLQNRAEPLLQVQSIDPGSLSVVLAGTPASKVGQDPSKHPLLRRWDQTFGDPSQGGLQQGPIDNAAQLVEENWLSLEDGIQIQFQLLPADGTYRTGDYWLIPARTATGDIQWPTGPQGPPLALPPHGVEHHYAPLALITVGTPTGVSVTQMRQKDFPHLLT